MKPLLLAAVLLVVPLQAQTADPVAGPAEAPAAEEDAEPEKPQVISLDAFRRRTPPKES